MSERIRTSTDLLTVLATIDHQHIAWQHKKLQAVYDWARHSLHLGYDIGGKVELTTDLGGDRDSGWYIYRECLVAGATGTATDIDFNPHHGGFWYAMVRLDREWCVSEWGTGPRRYWSGTAETCPEGYHKSKYDPSDDRGLFAIPVRHLRPATAEETTDA